MDWVQDWNSSKIVIDSSSIITPKLFVGSRNLNGTITGTAIGKFKLTTRNNAGSIISENLEGIYGFKDGYKTFSIENIGNGILGNGNQSIKCNAVTGKVELGSDVSLHWVSAQQAEDKNWATKLIYIGSTGIFIYSFLIL